MKRVIIISGGEFKYFQKLKNFFKKDDFLIAADHGMDYLYQIKVIPDLLIGDFDSCNWEIYQYFKNKGVAFKKYNCDKDLTDTQIAVQFALKYQPQELIIIAGIGDRIDHSLSNIYLLSSLVKKGIKLKIWQGNCEILVGIKEIIITGKNKEIVSLLAITDLVNNVTTEGLQYQLNNQNLTRDNPYAVSNLLVAPTAKIIFKEGILLVVHYFEKD